MMADSNTQMGWVTDILHDSVKIQDELRKTVSPLRNQLR